MTRFKREVECVVEYELSWLASYTDLRYILAAGKSNSGGVYCVPFCFMVKGDQSNPDEMSPIIALQLAV